nr:ulp1 protease family, C-terminal catalytic domain-containing protein [Tanacetum cinerariifolium]
MANEQTNVREGILSQLNTELEKEDMLANNLMGEMTRYLLKMRTRAEEEKKVYSMPLDQQLNSYRLHTLLMKSESDRSKERINSPTSYNSGHQEKTVKAMQPGADWAIVSLYLCAYVMRADVPFWLANGIKYHVPWIEVDKHIMSGVITLYDSLGVPPIEKRDWWKEIRLDFQSIIPTYLDECGVLKAKCLSLETYK